MTGLEQAVSTSPFHSDEMFAIFICTRRIYNCDGQLCPTGSSDPVKQIYKRFNSAAVKLFAPR